MHGAGEVGVTAVVPIATGSADSQKLIADEVLGLGHMWVLSRLGSSILRSSVASRSCLLRNRITEMVRSHLLFQMLLKRFRASRGRLVWLSSRMTTL